MQGTGCSCRNRSRSTTSSGQGRDKTYSADKLYTIPGMFASYVFVVVVAFCTCNLLRVLLGCGSRANWSLKIIVRIFRQITKSHSLAFERSFELFLFQFLFFRDLKLARGTHRSAHSTCQGQGQDIAFIISGASCS